MAEEGRKKWGNVEIPHQPEDLDLVLQWSFSSASIPHERALPANLSWGRGLSLPFSLPSCFPTLLRYPGTSSHLLNGS